MILIILLYIAHHVNNEFFTHPNGIFTHHGQVDVAFFNFCTYMHWMNHVIEASETDKHYPGNDYCKTSNIRRAIVGNKIVDHSVRCSWSIACRCCSNYIFNLDLIPAFKGLDKDNCKTKQETFKDCDFVHLILEI